MRSKSAPCRSRHASSSGVSGPFSLNHCSCSASDALPLKATYAQAYDGYLKASGYNEAFAALLKQSGGGEPDEKHSDQLEKKRTSIIRLQKKIFELEGSSRQLREELLRRIFWR